MIGVILASVFCSAVSYLCARKLTHLSPADALRPPVSKGAKKTLAERIPGLLKLFTVPGIMALRSIGRNPKRSMLSCSVLHAAFMITATLMSVSSLFDVFLFDNLEKVQHQDFTVYFEEPLKTVDVLSSVENENIEKMEPFAETQAKLIRGNGELDCTVQGIDRDCELVHLYDADSGTIHVASEGIVLSIHMAQRLGVGVGGWVDVK